MYGALIPLSQRLMQILGPRGLELYRQAATRGGALMEGGIPGMARDVTPKLLTGPSAGLPTVAGGAAAFDGAGALAAGVTGAGVAANRPQPEQPVPGWYDQLAQLNPVPGQQAQSNPYGGLVRGVPMSAPMPAARTPEMLSQPDERNQPINNGAQAQRFRPAPAPQAAMPANPPLPPKRPADAPKKAASNQYQSNNQVVQDGANAPINWGDSANPADFFRAEMALRGLLG